MAEQEFYQELIDSMCWEPSYVASKDFWRIGTRLNVDWTAFRDPFKLDFNDYVRVQAEKQKLLYRFFESVDRFKLDRDISPRWLEWTRIAYGNLAAAEYIIASSLGAVARYIPSPNYRAALLAQIIDEERHAQNHHKDALELSKLNPLLYRHRRTQFQNNWITQIFRSFFEEIIVAADRDIMENSVALNFLIEVGYGNLVFAALPGAGEANHDYKTIQHFMSVQSDESRHMALGNEVIHFALQHEENIPLVQWWVDKYSWRCWRVLTQPAALGLDYYTSEHGASFREQAERYIFKGFFTNVLEPLEKYGLRRPRYADAMMEESEYMSHALMQLLFRYRDIALCRALKINRADREWLSAKYPRWKAEYEAWWDAVDAGDLKEAAFFPVVCQVCQLPCIFPRIDRSRLYSVEWNGRCYSFCSWPCKDIFEHEPEQYSAPNQVDRIESLLESKELDVKDLRDFLGVPEDVQSGSLLEN